MVLILLRMPEWVFGSYPMCLGKERCCNEKVSKSLSKSEGERKYSPI